MDWAGVKEIEAYNRRAQVCRRKAKRLHEAKFGFKLLNPLLVGCLCFTLGSPVWHDAGLAVALLLTTAASYTTTLITDNYVPHTLCSALLIFLDPKFLILFLGNVLLGGMVVLEQGRLKDEPGYPEFESVHIIYID